MYRQSVFRVLSELPLSNFALRPRQLTNTPKTKSNVLIKSETMLRFSSSSSTSPQRLYIRRNKTHNRKTMADRPEIYITRRGAPLDSSASYQSFLCQRLFSNDSKLIHDDLTEEELKVLEELEQEEAKINELRAEELSSKPKTKSSLRQSVSQEYVPFENQQRIIQDVIEEIWNPLPDPEKLVYEPPEEFLERGKTGVFDLAELVDILREENGIEIVAITLPKEVDYADYMIIVTAKNHRHLMALATYVRKRYKMKNLKRTDVIPKIVSEDIQQGWVALDLGNIILHVFVQKERDFYDLELLWTVGPLFDDLCNAKDPEIVQLLNMMK